MQAVIPARMWNQTSTQASTCSSASLHASARVYLVWWLVWHRRQRTSSCTALRCTDAVGTMQTQTPTVPSESLLQGWRRGLIPIFQRTFAPSRPGSIPRSSRPELLHFPPFGGLQLNPGPGIHAWRRRVRSVGSRRALPRFGILGDLVGVLQTAEQTLLPLLMVGTWR